MSVYPRGTVTLLFTDIEGSTRLVRRLGESYGDVLAVHRSVLRRSFEEAHGHEIDTQGDSFFVAFARADEALAAAVAALDEDKQAALREACFRRLGSPSGPFTLTARAWFVHGTV
jgi:class 3 adenylate cyclase